jgi:hydroxyacylglutathione hydrolase
MPQSTLGFERLFNWALAEKSEDAFVGNVLAGQPEPPAYFARMKTVNRDDQIVSPIPVPPRPLDPSGIEDLLRAGATVVDIRPAAEYGPRHVVGTLNIPVDKSFANWAGSLVEYDRDVYLLAADATGDAVARASRAFALIGNDRVQGVFDHRAIEAAAHAGIEVTRTPQLTTAQFEETLARSGASHVIDVRGASEWNAGHIAGVTHIPLAELHRRLDEIPSGGTVVVHCQGGSRAAIAASVLERAGRDGVVNFSGGFRAWQDAGLPVETEAPAPAAAGSEGRKA